MAEAEDPDLLEPKTDAERELVKQLQEGRARREERLAAQQGEGLAPVAEDATMAEVSDTPQINQAAAVGGAAAATPAAGSSGRCFYTRLPSRLVKQKGLTAAELTAINLDKSPALRGGTAPAVQAEVAVMPGWMDCLGSSSLLL